MSHTTQRKPAREQVPCARILRDAAQYLALHGWIQGDMFIAPDHTYPRACALGAIRMSTLDVTTEFVTAVRIFADHLVRQHQAASVYDWSKGLPLEEQIVADWNDDTDRQVSHVIAVLIEAADEWDRITGGAA